MTEPLKKKIYCPSCRTEIDWQATVATRPFCSKRCQKSDYNDWLLESHRIPGEPNLIDEQSLEYSDGI